jgi:hypothetical protein
MKRFHTATLSYGDVSRKVQLVIDEKYPQTNGSWTWVVDVWDGYCIYRNGDDLFKQAFAITAGDDVELVGEPVQVKVEYEVVRGALQLAASARVVAGKDAQALIADLTAKNPLMAALKDSPNTHLIVLDLTSVGKPSNHFGETKYQLAKAGLADALPTLITKPIHVTPDLDGHFTAGADPVCIGVFLGGIGIENEDGSTTLRAIGTLWNGDFPEVVQQITEKRASLGASYEIEYLAASASRLNDKTIEIGKYAFSGGAILLKTAAAHPETQLLMADKDTRQVFDVMDEDDLPRLQAYLGKATSFTQADTLSYEERQNLKDSDFALVQTVNGRKVRRFPIQDEPHRKNAWARLGQAKDLTDSECAEIANKVIGRAKSAGDDWAKPYKKVNSKWTKDTTKGGASMKYEGIPAELEATVDAIVAAFKAELKAEHEKAIAAMGEKNEAAKAQAELAEKVKEVEASKKQAVELGNQVAALTAEKDGIKAELDTVSTKLAEQETATKLAETLASLKADYHLTDEQLKEPARLALAQKLAAAEEPLSGSEFKELIKGGKVVGAKGTEPVPLFAAHTPDNTPDPNLIGKTFPAAVGVRRMR